MLEEGGYGRGGKGCGMSLHEKMIFLIICQHGDIIEHICVNLSACQNLGLRINIL